MDRQRIETQLALAEAEQRQATAKMHEAAGVAKACRWLLAEMDREEAEKAKEEAEEAAADEACRRAAANIRTPGFNDGHAGTAVAGEAGRDK